MHSLSIYSLGVLFTTFAERKCPEGREQVIILQNGQQELDVNIRPNFNDATISQGLLGSEKTIKVNKKDVITVNAIDIGDTFRLMEVTFTVVDAVEATVTILSTIPDKVYTVS